MRIRKHSVAALSALAVIAVLATGCRHDVKPQRKVVAKPKSQAPTARKTVRPVPAAGTVTSYATSYSGQANNVMMRALSLVGTPYSYGGNTPEGGFDCSGLVNYVYRDVLNLRLPRTSRDLAAYQGPVIEPARLNTGDLVFFGSAGNVTHVGIYVGDGRFVHAPSTGGTVRLDRLDGAYWRDSYTGSKRLLGR